jgi:hypothetical protein
MSTMRRYQGTYCGSTLSTELKEISTNTEESGYKPTVVLITLGIRVIVFNATFNNISVI